MPSRGVKLYTEVLEALIAGPITILGIEARTGASLKYILSVIHALGSLVYIADWMPDSAGVKLNAPAYRFSTKRNENKPRPPPTPRSVITKRYADKRKQQRLMSSVFNLANQDTRGRTAATAPRRPNGTFLPIKKENHDDHSPTVPASTQEQEDCIC